MKDWTAQQHVDAAKKHARRALIASNIAAVAALVALVAMAGKWFGWWP
jgi:hypothetical protein